MLLPSNSARPRPIIIVDENLSTLAKLTEPNFTALIFQAFLYGIYVSIASPTLSPLVVVRSSLSQIHRSTVTNVLELNLSSFFSFPPSFRYRIVPTVIILQVYSATSRWEEDNLPASLRINQTGEFLLASESTPPVDEVIASSLRFRLLSSARVAVEILTSILIMISMSI